MPHLQKTNYTRAPCLGQAVKKSELLFGTLTGKLYKNYLAWYLKTDVGGCVKL